jgi:hypothetical protein
MHEARDRRRRCGRDAAMQRDAGRVEEFDLKSYPMVMEELRYGAGAGKAAVCGEIRFR